MFWNSYQAKLQAAFLALGLGVIAVTGWETTAGAAEALRQSTLDRLTAIRETKRRQVETYFRDLSRHVLALSSDESSIAALETFRSAWNGLPEAMAANGLREHYFREAAARAGVEPEAFVDRYFPRDGRHRALQELFISSNPNPVGTKDLLLRPLAGGAYGDAHARYHPTLHRYQSAFGFYDIFLIDARSSRILYTVLKEIDLGAKLDEEPYRSTSIARVYQRALELEGPDQVVMEDYTPYVASYFAPAAFVGAPIWRAGAVTGVLVIQVSVAEVDRVMTGDRNWASEGLGETGQAYIAASDLTLRSDARFEIESPQEYMDQLRKAGVAAETLRRIDTYRTAVLATPVSRELAALIRERATGTGIGRDIRGVEVLRSYAPVAIPGVDWFVVAKMDASEALAPVAALRMRILLLGLLAGAGCFFAAWILSRTVTRPVLALAAAARRMGAGDLETAVPVESQDEIGELAVSLRNMAADLRATTVSRDVLDAAHQQLQRLTERLMDAEENERRRLARELHDDLTQRVASLAIDAGRCKSLPALEDGAALRAGFERLQRDLATLAEDIHRLSRSLHPAVIEDLGLGAALETEGRAVFERGGPLVRVDVAADADRLPLAVRVALYRISQEAIRNAVKHAAAEEVAVSWRFEDRVGRLCVEDDGRGMDPDRKSGGLGLVTMAERARSIGAILRVEPAAAGGTRVIVEVPYHVEATNPDR